MALRDTSIDPVLLKSARAQFIEKGFAKASVSEICRNAGVTTGALYIRYKGKEELYDALVADAVAMMETFMKTADVDIEHLSDRELLLPWYGDKSKICSFFDMFENVRDQFTLLLTCSDGTKYQNFHHDFAQKLTDADYCYYIEAYKRGFATELVTKEQLHIYLTAYWDLFYEPFIHGMTRSEIDELCAGIERWINWKALLGLPDKMPF
ncbi:TetR/AcrR family transcriptional regulator [Ruminococcus sp. XPD3002]|uniref:TetR/AcrR family transcriptional regulator n=1 Tax=Ruminococcus sp. XPD3002 TaxID=1452269 RepID=UPI00091AF59C|nr:transcriptional regulator, TetR family [Ruminococcus flavefaciens]